MASVVAPEAYRAFSSSVNRIMEHEIVGEHTSNEEHLLPAPRSWFEDNPCLTHSMMRSPTATSAQSVAAVQPQEERYVSKSRDVEEPRENDIEALAVDASKSGAVHRYTAGNDAAAATDDDDEEYEDSPKLPIGEPFPSPSWTEISCQVLPTAARELLSSTVQRMYYAAHVGYASTRWQRKYSDLGNSSAGYYRKADDDGLPPFSSLSWIERQLVQEWRTYLPDNNPDMDDNEEDDEFQRARTLVPAPIPRPRWTQSDACFACRKTFGPARLRHHCRNCGHSFCQAHSSRRHKLPHLGYVVPERVCDACKRRLLEYNLTERITWRLARCRDHCEQGNLTPYFDTGLDTVENMALRITQAALAMARSIPLGAQATVAVETVEVLRKYGLNGIYTIMLRQEFLAAADLLRKALGINRTAWPLSVHELSAAIFYALAQHRAMRGLSPDREHNLHSFRGREETASATLVDAAGIDDQIPVSPVCDPLPDRELESLIFYAPIALNFIYAEKEVDMQLLAAQQGWRLLYAQLELIGVFLGHDLPASALFIHDEQKIACLAVRGTTTIQDVVTDIRQLPLPFPEAPEGSVPPTDDGWTEVRSGQGLAVCGMANAATNLYREHIDSLLYYAKRGYRIRLVGHSLGGGVATLLGVLVRRDFVRESLLEQNQTTNLLKVYSYGSPPCVDSKLAEYVTPFVTTVVLHDDAIPRLTPTSCRELLKALLHIRETWVKEHLPSDILAITDRAKTAWAPRWRGSFTLPTSSSSLKRYCRKHIQNGRKKLLSVREKLVGDDRGTDKSSDNCSNDEFSTLSGQEYDSAASKEVPATLVVDYMGGLDIHSAGVVIDGDEFFDAGGNLIEESDDESCDPFGDAVQPDSHLEERATAQDEDSPDVAGEDEEEGRVVEEEPSDNDDAPGTVVLEEIPLTRMFVPGKVVHIYSHRGVFKAAYVPRAFRELRRISLAGNMLSDHTCKAYYEGLLEVKSVRRATETPPRWTAFDEDDTCSCCASRFTWASTSDNYAQEARDKHNCRSCGTLVCDPCSLNRVPLPSIGLTVAVRVCDRCYNDIDGSKSPNLRSSSFCEDRVSPCPLESSAPERQRPRTSPVVEELAARVTTPSFGLASARCSVSSMSS